MSDVGSALGTTNTSATNSNISAGQSSLNESYTTFLTLLTTQLQNQDPTSPMDTNAFTQQLVSMTGVQQQLLTNQLLQQMVSNSASSGVAGSVGLIGETVTANISNVTLSGGAATWNYNLGTATSEETLTISDSTGKAVWSGTGSNLAAGAHTLNWNGKDFSGVQLPDGGTYTLSIAAVDSAGNQVTTSSSITGTVSSLTQQGGTAMVQIGATAVPVSSITSVASQTQ